MTKMIMISGNEKMIADIADLAQSEGLAVLTIVRYGEETPAILPIEEATPAPIGEPRRRHFVGETSIHKYIAMTYAVGAVVNLRILRQQLIQRGDDFSESAATSSLSKLSKLGYLDRVKVGTYRVVKQIPLELILNYQTPRASDAPNLL